MRIETSCDGVFYSRGVAFATAAQLPKQVSIFFRHESLRRSSTDLEPV
jgi:hypothetical protein